MILDEASGKLTQKMFAERDRIASSQSFCQLKISICWANCFTTEDEFLKPHVEKSSVLSDRYRSGLHILADISFSSANAFSFNLERYFFLANEKVYRQHEYSGQ